MATGINLSICTDAELVTLGAAAKTAMGNLIAGEVQSSSAPDGGAWANYTLGDFLSLIDAISNETDSRSDELGGVTGGMIQVEFVDPA